MSFIELVFYKAIFFDDNGFFIGSKSIKANEDSFDFMKKKFLFNHAWGSFFKLYNFIFNFIPIGYTKYFFYNINVPYPINMNMKIDSPLTTEQLSCFIDTKQLIKLNALSQDKLSSIFNLRNILIGLVVIVFFYYMYSQGKLW